ncbi:TonB-dependent receptor [Thermoflexibacter ruber]|uniref:Outer membrane receptor proteins, mostly Fe transport n=1 Tax=Thermoflexibacter ruber TaxID=1003 RepID=A0A1I2I949_9BACT|nr:TonB-dependent receptor [Thermoflexibacter ruber]SFF38188.1 Outer membrane receptor proteins, mostly Fe transport [Thermoflexibacter ruber]
MKPLFFITLFFILFALTFASPAFAQNANKAVEKFTVSGNIKDLSNGEGLIGATITVKEMPTVGTTTNSYGFFSLTLPKGNYTLIISYIGYINKVITVNFSSNRIIDDIQIAEDQKQLQEVVVMGNTAEEKLQSIEMSTNKLEIKTIKSMPALLGEVDIVRSIQLLPGVSTVGEGASGFNVRGGGVDHNLILQDEAPVYNSSHLFGFFSVFNPDAVKDVKLVKGGIPAQYGGRLASLLDVRLREGNSKKFTGAGGIGTVSSRLTLEAPIVKDKSSFIIAGRRTYADMFLKLSSDEALNKNKLYFYDLSAKWNYDFGQKDRLYISGYFGRDVFKFGEDFGMNWGNVTGTVRWNHVFSPKLFSNFTLIYSDYDYNLGVPSGAQSFDWKSNIVNYSAKADFSYFLNTNNTINFGASAIKHDFRPGKVSPVTEGSIFSPYEIAGQNALEYGLYVDDEQNIGKRLALQYGVRWSMFNYMGGRTIYDYEGIDGQRKKPTNERNYGSGEVVSSYNNFEPRFSLRYTIDETSSIKLSYNRMAQYIHLISNTTAASPLDIWQPTTNNIKPELADQVALGYFKNLKDNNYEFSAEAYYKTMTNQIDYIDGADLLLNNHLEGDLLYGQGRSYGLELYAKKNTGKLTGWISYTLAKTERQIEGINTDYITGVSNWYPAKYDRRHNLSAVLMYELNPRWTFSANFSYISGVATTFPDSRYEYEGLIVPHNSEGSRNNYRVPAYHRLDLSATLHPKTKNGKKGRGEWVFTLYNAYARRNPFSVYFRQEVQKDSPTPTINTQAVRLSLFGSVLPSVTYNFKF